MNERQSTKEITPKSLYKYNRSVIKRFTGTEYGHDNQGKKSRKGLVKMSSISNNRARQSDPRLAWLMFHKIAQMYRDIREQESEEATELILNLRANLNSNNTSSSSPITPKISIQQPTMPLDPKKYPKTSKKSSLVHPRFGIVMRSASIPMDHGSELSVPTSSSWVNVFVNPKQERDPPSCALL